MRSANSATSCARRAGSGAKPRASSCDPLGEARPVVLDRLRRELRHAPARAPRPCRAGAARSRASASPSRARIATSASSAAASARRAARRAPPRGPARAPRAARRPPPTMTSASVTRAGEAEPRLQLARTRARTPRRAPRRRAARPRSRAAAAPDRDLDAAAREPLLHRSRDLELERGELARERGPSPRRTCG